MKLTREQAIDLLSNRKDEELGLTIEADEQGDTGRWVSYHQLVVKDRDGKYWATSYERGLTESQDIMPFEDLEFVHFDQVVKIPVTTYEYKGMGFAE